MKCKTGKVRHKTKEAACVVATRMKAKPIMNVFKCESCGGWHLGRTNDPSRWADRIGHLLRRHEDQILKRNS